MSIEFNLCEMVERGHRQSLDENSLIRKLKQRYGNLLQGLRSIDAVLPFKPLEEVKTALNNQGFYPSVKVMSGALPILPDTPIIVQNDEDDSSDEDDEDWVNPGDDDEDSEGDTSLDTDDENESDEEAENETH